MALVSGERTLLPFVKFHRISGVFPGTAFRRKFRGSDRTRVWIFLPKVLAIAAIPVLGLWNGAAVASFRTLRGN